MGKNLTKTRKFKIMNRYFSSPSINQSINQSISRYGVGKKIESINQSINRPTMALNAYLDGTNVDRVIPAFLEFRVPEILRIRAESFQSIRANGLVEFGQNRIPIRVREAFALPAVLALVAVARLGLNQADHADGLLRQCGTLFRRRILLGEGEIALEIVGMANVVLFVLLFHQHHRSSRSHGTLSRHFRRRQSRTVGWLGSGVWLIGLWPGLLSEKKICSGPRRSGKKGFWWKRKMSKCHRRNISPLTAHRSAMPAFVSGIQ